MPLENNKKMHTGRNFSKKKLCQAEKLANMLE